MVHIPVQSSEPSDASALPQSQAEAVLSASVPQVPHLRQPDHSDSHARHTVHLKNLPRLPGRRDHCYFILCPPQKLHNPLRYPLPAVHPDVQMQLFETERFNTLSAIFPCFIIYVPLLFPNILSDLLCGLCRNSCLLCLILCLSLLCRICRLLCHICCCICCRLLHCIFPLCRCCPDRCLILACNRCFIAETASGLADDVPTA